MDALDLADRISDNSQTVADRVINVHTTKPYEWVLENVFSEGKCGKLVRTLFWKSDKPGSCHFFIEFAHKESVAIAQREAGAGVTVHCLSRNMNMFGIFDCLARGIDPPKKRTITDTEGSQSGDPQDSSKTSNTSFGPPYAKRPRAFENNGPARRMSRSPYRDIPSKSFRHPADGPQRNYPYHSKPNQSWNSTLDNRRFQGSYNSSYSKSRYRKSDIQSSNGSVSPARRSRDVSLHYGDLEDDRFSNRGRDISPPRRMSHRRASDASSRRASDASMKRPPETAMSRPSDTSTSPDAYNPTSPRFAIPTKPLVINPFGSSDLDHLSNDNIVAVIESLKASFSGPETWMTVAAHYRRMKRHKNALAIVDTMLEVMRERGMEKVDLRPALLLMAQCHYSIAKLERREPESLEDSNKHFVLLLDWLRETYGPNTPALDAIAQQLSLRSSWNTEIGAKPIFQQNPYDLSQRVPFPGYDPLQPSTGLFETHSSVPARIDAVQEENTRLRDHQSETTAELAAVRAALQEAESATRATETKLAQALDNQRLANSRVSRESEARRRAEERLAQERTAWERRREELREDGARGAVRELSAILSLAARAPMPMLEATRVFCEARGRLEREPPATV